MIKRGSGKVIRVIEPREFFCVYAVMIRRDKISCIKTLDKSELGMYNYHC